MNGNSHLLQCKPVNYGHSEESCLGTKKSYIKKDIMNVMQICE